MIRDFAGNLYGTTYYGGGSNVGVVFKVNPAGQETVLYTFTGAADGGNPYAGVILSAGNLYGTAVNGGAFGKGVVFKLNPTTGQETVLYSFTGGADGGNPYGGVIFDTAGNLYGTTQYGCPPLSCGAPGGYGVVFKLDPDGQETVLYAFTGGAGGGNPFSGVIRDSAGTLFGTASVVFELTNR